MARRQPPQRDFAPVAARYRVHYRKSGPMRFSSARDFQRSLERAIRRGGVPVASTAGFSPHPRISYTNTVATGVASRAEYLEIALTAAVDEGELAGVLRAGLPPGFDVAEVVPALSDDLAGRLQASAWEFELPGVAAADAAAALEVLLRLDSYPLHRMTKGGGAQVDVRAAIISGRQVGGPIPAAGAPSCAILLMVVRHVTPSVRPTDVLTALSEAAGLELPQAPRICRLAQGPLLPDGMTIGDPLAQDRRAASRV